MSFWIYVAGSVLAFCVVLIVIQGIGLLTTGMNQEQLTAISPLLTYVWLIANLLGGFAGSYLVARRRRGEYVLTGLIVAVLAYILIYLYTILVEGLTTDVFAFICLTVGGLSGSMLFGSRHAAATPSSGPSKPSNP